LHLGSIGTVEASEIGRELGFKRHVEPVRLGWRVVVKAQIADAKIVTFG